MNRSLSDLRRPLHLGFAVAVALSAGVAMTCAEAVAAVPVTASLEGALMSTGGGPAADGQYQVTFAIYPQQSGGNAAWTESATLSAKGGQFSWQLGTKTPLSAAGLDLATAWFGLQIGSDPELPRQPVGSSLYALRAAIAENIACSGCIKVGALDPGVLSAYAKAADLGAYAKASDLSNYAKTADLGTYAKTSDLNNYVKAASLALVAGSGSFNDLKDKPAISDAGKTGAYGDLTGKPVLAKVGTSCGTGLVLIGFKADGGLDCAPSGVAADYIDEISNGLIFNQFVDKTNGIVDVAIPDGNGAGVSTSLDFPDIGTAQAIWVDVDVLNSDVSSLTVELYGPGMATPYILYSKSKSGTTLKTSFNKDTAIAVGDMNKDWIGKNPKGTWSITVKDPLKNQLNSSTDGKFTWGLAIQTLSTKKIQIKGNLIVDGTLQVGGTSGGISGNVVFKDLVSFEDSWCPTQANGEKSLTASGVCAPAIGAGMDWIAAVDYCAGLHAELCSGAQSLVLRNRGYLASGHHPNTQSANGNWIASYSDNDSQWHQESVGHVSDDQGSGNTLAAPCCYNYRTPDRPADQIVKVNASDKGQRVVLIHNTADTTFPYAANICSRLNADLCDKSQLVYIRTAGKISASPFWDRSGEDSDGTKEYGAGFNFPDDVTYHGSKLAFACCATELPDAAKSCPAGYTDTGGVCWNKVNNGGSNWVSASNDCAATGAHVCSVAQSSVLRRKNVITHGGNWAGSYNDCDGQCSGGQGIGNVGNDINYNSSYGYACCL